MDGIVYKYDLVSKELLFKFKTNATNEMIMYDKDDKLLVASNEEIRLWDFYDHKEEAPELISTMISQLKVEHVYVNKNSRTMEKGVKLPLYVLVTC